MEIGDRVKLNEGYLRILEPSERRKESRRVYTIESMTQWNGYTRFVIKNRRQTHRNIKPEWLDVVKEASENVQ